MLTSDPDVPHMFFIQISATITKKFVIKDISAKNADYSPNKVSRLLFSWSKILGQTMLLTKVKHRYRTALLKSESVTSSINNTK